MNDLPSWAMGLRTYYNFGSRSVDVAKFEVLCRSDTLAKFGWLDPHFKESPPNMEESHLPTTCTIIPNNGQVSSEHGQLPHGPGPPAASCITCQILLG